MRLPLLLIAILAAPAALGSQDRHPDAVVIYECDFTEDVNFDNWPDKWRRQYGPDLPRYVEVGLRDDPTAVSGRCLSVDMNGGSVVVEGPHASISQKFSYQMSVKIRTAGIHHAKARVRLDFCNDDREVVRSFPSRWIEEDTNGWVTLPIGPVNVDTPEASLARITLEVRRGKHADLNGWVAIDDVWMARLPKMSVFTGSPSNVYEDPREVVVTCTLSGIREQAPDILFELLDASSHKQAEQALQMEGRLITEKLSKSSDIINPSTQRKSYEGSTSWHPPIQEHGFYRVKVRMQNDHGTMDERVISIAVVPPLDKPEKGEFGWSLAGDDIPLSFDHLRRLLPRAAVSWVKLPVWYSPSEPEKGDELVVLAELLGADEIEVVGVVDKPPAELDLSKKMDRDVTIADLVSAESADWLPSLDVVLTRLSLRVRWWQFGLDNDTSFADFNQLEDEILKLRSLLFRFGQDVNIGFGWPWNESTESDRPATWDFMQFSANPPLTGKELASYLQLPQRKNTVRWVLVEPLPRYEYSLEDRTRDLVDQMLAAKIEGADGIFVAKPFDNQKGIMEEAGTPGELFLPWRTTAFLLSGAEYLGKFVLPGNSENRVFETSDGRVLMVIWNRVPTTEKLYLGDPSEVNVLDVWGRAVRPEQDGNQQIIQVSSLPSFVVGLNPQVTKMRLGLKFDNPRLPSVFGVPHRCQLQVSNHFNQGVGGTVELVGDEDWQFLPPKIDFKLSAGESSGRPFRVTLPISATSGVVRIKADVTFVADKEYEFSVFRDLIVGDPDIEVDVQTRLDQNGNLIVEQRMVNHSGEPLDFKCRLYAPERRYQRMQVFRLGDEYDLKTYRYPNGRELLGKEILLSAEEIGGSRVFNVRFTAEQ